MWGMVFFVYRCLDVHLFERGYGKDAAMIAKEALNYVSSCSCLLINLFVCLFFFFCPVRGFESLVCISIKARDLRGPKKKFRYEKKSCTSVQWWADGAGAGREVRRRANRYRWTNASKMGGMGNDIRTYIHRHIHTYTGACVMYA